MPAPEAPAEPVEDRALPGAPVVAARATAPTNRTLHWVLWSTLIVVIFGLTANFVRQQWRGMQRTDITPMEHFNTVPDFTLTERSGAGFGSDQLKGKIWLANFFFSTCPGPCLRMNTKMGELQQALIRDHAGVKLVSFTIDPAHDTPAVLAQYANRFKAQADRWFFLTGARDTIYDLAQRGFMLVTTEAPAENGKPAPESQFIHSTKIVLVDRQGVVRRYYDSENPELTQHVLSDVGSLLREQPEPSKTNAAAAVSSHP